MTATTDATIQVRDGTGYQYNFRCLSLKDDISQPVIAIPLVNTDSDSTFVFRFSGQDERISLSFEIFDDGTDTAGGTYDPGGVQTDVTTITEQITYLRDVIYSKDYDVDWYFSDASGRYFSSDIKVLITKLTINNPAGKSAAVVSASMELQRGNIGNL